MKFMLFLLGLLPFHIIGQTDPPGPVTEMEDRLFHAEQELIEDEGALQELDDYLRHPLDINMVTENEWKKLMILDARQIEAFFLYRKLLGPFISLYELQAIPLWQPALIRKLLPYLTLGKQKEGRIEWNNLRKEGKHRLLVRLSRKLQLAKGYKMPVDSGGYIGTANAWLLRYSYQWDKKLRAGFTLEKDAGESWMYRNKKGVEFLSFHIKMEGQGWMKKWIMGDYKINMGQGLIHWQGISFGGYREVAGLTRQSVTIDAYTSAGEFNFHRGTAITMGKGKREWTMFVSRRKLDARMETDTTTALEGVASIIKTGDHRTRSDLAKKGELSQVAAGGQLRWRGSRYELQFNLVHIKWSKPLIASDEPYRLFSISGKEWSNASIAYQYSWKNFLFYGEMAMDQQLHNAQVHGLLASLDSKLDLGLEWRNHGSRYQSIYGNANTQNTNPSNERGWLATVNARVSPQVNFFLRADWFVFPWLKYRNTAVGMEGHQIVGGGEFRPDKKQVFGVQFINKVSWQDSQEERIRFPSQNKRRSFRVEWQKQFSTRGHFKQRVEWLNFLANAQEPKPGFLAYIDLFHQPFRMPLSCNMRIQYFDASDYDARMYAYENDVPYYSGLSSFFHSGWRYYFNGKYKWKTFSVSFKWYQTIFNHSVQTGAGADLRESRFDSGYRVQWQMEW